MPSLVELVRIAPASPGPALLGVSAVIVLLWALLRSNKRGMFPPGPPAKPVVGNILDLSPHGSWHKLTSYKQIYGDIVFFHGLGTNVLVLNTQQRITDLLEKRATTYSDRPQFTVASEIMGLGQSMPMLAYNDEWRAQRKLAHVALGPGAVKKYHGVQEDLAALLAKQILGTPQDFFSHVRLTASRIVLSVTYGLSVEKAESEYIAHAEDTMEMISQVTVPGAFLCDSWPWMKHLPGFLPFQKTAARGRDMIERLVTKPLEYVKEQMRAGTAAPSLTQDLLLMDASDPVAQEKRVKWTAGCLYGAGGETTYTTVLVFLAAMALHPEVQRKAQAEIDAACGTDSLPTIADRGRLPFVEAVIKETMRWHPALPLGLARATAKDDVYEGYTIPKGTIVLPNIWSIAFEHHGPHDPKLFMPERFFGPDPPPDPASWAFGFSRRLCPGKPLAENSVFILIATILAAFDVAPPSDKPLDLQYSTGLVSYPLPFDCKITPRSEARAKQVTWRAAQCVGV